MAWITHTSRYISQVTQWRQLCFPSKLIVDLSEAFDIIDHSTLLRCLQDWFSVGGSTLKWFSSDLTGHYQSVKIGSTLLDLQKLSVLQGSVLGPLLFSLYTSPLSTPIGSQKGVNFHFYADNAQK